MAVASLSAQTTCVSALRPVQSEASPSQSSLSLAPTTSALASLSASPLHRRAAERSAKPKSVCAAAEAAVEEVAVEEAADEGSSLVDSVEGKHRLVLKFVWMEKNIGITVDQVIPGKGSVPLAPYMFWPRRDAWEELKTVLESKPWLPRRKIIILLNQATDIINLWQSQAYKQG